MTKEPKIVFALLMLLVPGPASAWIPPGLGAYQAAAEAEGIYRGEVVEVGRELVRISVTRVIKGPERQAVEVWVGRPPYGTTTRKPPDFREGQDVVVAVSVPESGPSRLWPPYWASQMFWPPPAMPGRPELSAAEAADVLAAMLRLARSTGLEEQREILASLFRHESTAVGLEVRRALSACQPRPDRDPETYYWWRKTESSRFDDIYRMVLPEYLDFLGRLEAGAINSVILGPLMRYEGPLVIPAVTEALVRDGNAKGASIAPSNVAGYYQRWGRRYPLPPGVIEDLREGRSPGSMISLSRWALRAQRALTPQRLEELQEELSSEDPLARAAARGEWVVLTGEEPEGFTW